MRALEGERVEIKGLHRRMCTVLFNIQIRVLELGTLSIDLMKGVYYGK